MNIDQQIRSLIDGAPSDGRTPAAVEAIAPALQLIAEQLKHTQYYVLQNLEQQWVVTTLNHRNQPELSKKVIYAFPTLQDLTSGPYFLRDPQILAVPMPVVHVLFQLIAMKTVDSLVFFEVPGNSKATAEISRQNFQELLQRQLQRMQKPGLPPDVA
jgi:hypothetical protein